jgi:hypothetical protein
MASAPISASSSLAMIPADKAAALAKNQGIVFTLPV